MKRYGLACLLFLFVSVLYFGQNKTDEVEVGLKKVDKTYIKTDSKKVSVLRDTPLEKAGGLGSKESAQVGKETSVVNHEEHHAHHGHGCDHIVEEQPDQEASFELESELSQLEDYPYEIEVAHEYAKDIYEENGLELLVYEP